MVQLLTSTPRARKGAACKECSRRKRRCVHVSHSRELALLESTDVVRQPNLARIPACRETLLCRDFVHTLHSLRLDHTWLRMLPCRVGQDEVVDSAVTAVVRNKDFALRGHQSNVAGSLRCYIESVETLRLAMERRKDGLSDEILMSVALICVCESLMQSEMFACFSHWGAMAAIILARPPPENPSELTRAIFYHLRNQTFHIPVARGCVSRFDDPQWYTLEPAGYDSLPPEISQLRLLSNQLLIRLPRLVLLVRSLREKYDAETAQQAIHLAVELDKLKDEAAESKLLHRIKVVKTSSPEDVPFIPFSFEYQSLGELETAVVYWKYQILFGGLICRLSSICPEAGFDTDSVQSTMERMGINAMMSNQYALARHQYAHARGVVAMPTAWLAVWALWDNRPEFRGITRHRWREWNRQRMNETIDVWQWKASESEMDDASDLLRGGPRKGILVTAFQDVPLWTMAAPSAIV